MLERKPHPMPYLEGLRAVNAVPDLSLAFEDSRSGVQSASATGIAAIGIRTSLSDDDMVAVGARMTATHSSATTRPQRPCPTWLEGPSCSMGRCGLGPLSDHETA
jgi:beta-phosphoglucomutase-like phosphatase (HAD superfamily)